MEIIEWQPEKENDKEWLILYYQSRIDHWKNKERLGFSDGIEIIIKNFEAGIKKLQKEIKKDSV